MGIIRNLTFDGVSLKNYGVGITGEGVYDAPKRAVNMITIPGRDGDFALDEGRFENIEITYPAGAFDKNQPDFAEKMSTLRNELASRIGYKRITDEYNPDEYRLGIFKDGLEVDPAHYSRAGEFELKFNCKPQRFLTSGEEEQEIQSGGTITNPTLFESKPLLLVYGHGAININDDSIVLNDVAIGEVLLKNGYSLAFDTGYATNSYQTTKMNSGDPVTLKSSVLSYEKYLSEGETAQSFSGGAGVSGAIINGGEGFRVNIDIGALDFTFGTASTQSLTFNYTVTTNLQTHNAFVTVAVGYELYAGGRQGVRIAQSESGSPGSRRNRSITFGDIVGDSSRSALGIPSYIDLDIGEAYKYLNNEVVGINNAVVLPADLPTLKPGANEITFDNTITQLKIIPRWWKI